MFQIVFNEISAAEISRLGTLEQLELLGGERWYVQLEPHPDGLSQPQVPDWFGYRRIDRG